jgi:hypothetical protein
MPNIPDCELRTAVLMTPYHADQRFWQRSKQWRVQWGRHILMGRPEKQPVIHVLVHMQMRPMFPVLVPPALLLTLLLALRIDTTRLSINKGLQHSVEPRNGKLLWDLMEGGGRSPAPQWG